MGFFGVIRDIFASTPDAATLSVADSKAWMASQPGLQVLDVRTEAEFRSGHLRDARCISVFELEQRLAELDKSRPVLIHCRSGHRSATALNLMLKNGFQAKHLAGGILAWMAEGNEVVK